jgi:hypothetical protein
LAPLAWHEFGKAMFKDATRKACTGVEFTEEYDISQANRQDQHTPQRFFGFDLPPVLWRHF